MKNNKGFSLVELIIVVAIMAVLVGVLAPQYLRYVEKSRIQADKTTFSEVVSAVKTVSSTDEGFDALTGTDVVNVNVTNGAATVACSNTTLLGEVSKTLGGTALTYKSKLYRNQTGSVTVTISGSEATFTVVGPGY